MRQVHPEVGTKGSKSVVVGKKSYVSAFVKLTVSPLELEACEATKLCGI